MATSQNGYRANDRSLIKSYTIPGGKVALRKGDVATVLVHVAQRFHAEVEPIAWPGNWGYAERPIRGSSTTLSNHASGTAIDLNAPKHPLGVRNTFTASQRAAIDRIMRDLDGVVRAGKDYKSRPDDMHFEINKGTAAVAKVAARIRGTAVSGGTTKPATPAPAPEKGIFGMTDIRSAYYAPEQIIQPGTTARIRTAERSHMLAPAKKGTLVSGSVSFTVFDLPEGQSAEVRLLTRDWKAGRDLWTSERVDIVWGTSGYPNAVSIPVVGKSRNGTDTTEYMLEVRSKASSPIKVAHVKTDVLHS